MKKYIVTVNGTKYEVAVEEADPNAVYAPAPKAEAPKAEAPKAEAPKAAPAVSGEGAKVTAPLPGNILKVNFAVGDAVKKGDVLCILALDREHSRRAVVHRLLRGLLVAARGVDALARAAVRHPAHHHVKALAT